MEEKGKSSITNKRYLQYKSFTNPLFEQIDDHKFRIKINSEIRSLGVKDIMMIDREFLIRSRDDAIVHIKNYECCWDLIDEIEDQLLENDDEFFSSDYIEKILSFLSVRCQIINEIIDFFDSK